MLTHVIFLSSGIARGCGWQHLGAYVNLGSFYLVGIPMAVLLGFVLKMEGKGLWIGISCGSIVQFLLLATVAFFSNWQKMVCSFSELSKSFQNQRWSQIICSLMTFCLLCSPIKRGREFSATSCQTRYLRNRMDRKCLNFGTSPLIPYPEREEAHENFLFLLPCFGGTLNSMYRGFAERWPLLCS